MIFVLLIVALLIWLGYHYGRDQADGQSKGDPRNAAQGHSLYLSVAELRERYADERKGRLARISPDVENWLDDYLSECESPAEEVLLRAIVNEYALLPDSGMLNGEGLVLQLQVDKGAYRVDFLANGWLVIEVDGAEYHTSPEQLVRDNSRDRYLESLGHTVLRVVAKVLFHQPEKALSDIRSALAVGRKQNSPPLNQAPVVQPLRPRPTNVFSAFSRGVEAVGDAAKQINDFADRARAIQRATGVGEKIFSEEKRSINSAMEIASSKMSLERYIDGDSDRRDRIESIRAQLEAALVDSDDSGNRKVQIYEPIPHISDPAVHADPEINAIIERKHSALLAERAEYFENVRKQLRAADGRLPTLVRDALIDVGHHATWVELTGSPGQFVRLQTVALSPAVKPKMLGNFPY